MTSLQTVRSCPCETRTLSTIGSHDPLCTRVRADSGVVCIIAAEISQDASSNSGPTDRLLPWAVTRGKNRLYGSLHSVCGRACSGRTSEGLRPLKAIVELFLDDSGDVGNLIEVKETLTREYGRYLMCLPPPTGGTGATGPDGQPFEVSVRKNGTGPPLNRSGSLIASRTMVASRLIWNSFTTDALPDPIGPHEGSRVALEPHVEVKCPSVLVRSICVTHRLRRHFCETCQRYRGRSHGRPPASQRSCPMGWSSCS